MGTHAVRRIASAEEQARSELNLVMAASREAIVMVEAGATGVPEDIMVDALFFGHESVQPILDLQEKLRAAVGQEKRTFTPPEPDANGKQVFACVRS